MLVPAVLVASTSPSPANLPAVIDTVALSRSRLSGSLTVRDGDRVTAPPFSVYDTLAATPDRVGGSFTLRIVTVVVCAVAVALPSLTVQVTVRD
jgi:hypothetical protein